MSEQPKRPSKRDVGPWVLPPPWLPPQYEIADIVAVQACVSGTATDEQQKRAMRWIVEQGCLTYDLGWHPDLADFAAGRRFVGTQIVKLTKLNVAVLKKKETNAA